MRKIARKIGEHLGNDQQEAGHETVTQKLDQCSAQLGGALAIPHPWSFALDCHQVLGLFCNGRPPKEKPQAKPPKGDKTYSANSNFRSHTRTGCTTKSSTTSRRESHASNRAKSGTLIKGERSPKSRASAPVCLPQNYCGSPNAKSCTRAYRNIGAPWSDNALGLEESGTIADTPEMAQAPSPPIRIKAAPGNLREAFLSPK